MTERLKKLCALLGRCVVFADVGCDHGYCADYMLGSGLCKSAIITDISASSLSKAERLLKKYIAEGCCRSVCCDGLDGVAEGSADLVLIAGMGGEEILKILKQSYIPQSFVFQPMKNAAQLRAYLIENGCSITYDGLFTETRGGLIKHYFAIKGNRTGGTSAYSAAQLAYGRDSLGTAELEELLKYELNKNFTYAQGELSPSSRAEVEDRIKFIKGVLSGETC